MPSPLAVLRQTPQLGPAQFLAAHPGWATAERRQGGGDEMQARHWPDGLGGVPEGRRNATAVSLIGRILARLPEDLWGTAGWGGLKEWNGRNPAPLPERELRAVFVSIARRERDGRSRGVRPPGNRRRIIRLAVYVRLENRDAAPANASPPHSPSGSC